MFIAQQKFLLFLLFLIFFCGAFELKYFLCKYFHSSKGQEGAGERDWSVPSWVMALDVCQAASPSLSPLFSAFSFYLSCHTCLLNYRVATWGASSRCCCSTLPSSFLCASFDAGYKFQMNLTTTTTKTNQRKPQQQQQWALNCCMNCSRTSKRNWVYCLTHKHTHTNKVSQTHLSTPCYGCSCRQGREGGKGVNNEVQTTQTFALHFHHLRRGSKEGKAESRIG